eukprot:1584981-Alexandrium_andersonii.AAC.1
MAGGGWEPARVDADDAMMLALACARAVRLPRRSSMRSLLRCRRLLRCQAGDCFVVVVVVGWLVMAILAIRAI